MIDLDRQFIFKLNTSSLPMKEKGSGVFVFRCPLCGDSKKSKHKARGHLIPNRELNIYWYTCHNCFTNIPFGKFLHRIDASLYAMYRKDAFVYKHGKPRQESKPDIEGQKSHQRIQQKNIVTTEKSQNLTLLLNSNHGQNSLLQKRY
jgi:hypothetical protein